MFQRGDGSARLYGQINKDATDHTTEDGFRDASRRLVPTDRVKT